MVLGTLRHFESFRILSEASSRVSCSFARPSYLDDVLSIWVIASTSLTGLWCCKGKSGGILLMWKKDWIVDIRNLSVGNIDTLILDPML